MVFQKPQEQTDNLPPPCTLILDFTLTHTCFGRSQLHSLGQLTHTRRSDGAPEPDGALRAVARKKILHIIDNFMLIVQNRSLSCQLQWILDRIYDDFSLLLFLHVHRETSVLANELPEESDQFRFLRAACLANIKGSVGLILAKVSDMRISIPFDLSVRSFIPVPCFIRSRRPLPSFSFLHVLSKRHMLGVYFRTLSVSLLIIVLA